ncbi:reverse transcriptase domain-containing protein [Tanacetum coccineum]
MSGSPTPSPDPVFESLSPYFTPFGDNILFLEELLNKDPTPNLPPIPLPDFKNMIEDFSSILEILSRTIIAKELKREEKEQLLKILMEDDFKPAIEHQRRVNPKIHEVIKAEVVKLLDAGLIYPISDSPWSLAGNEFYCFLDGFYRYFQIPIDPKDQDKTTFTCPYGTFAYPRMPFGLCNAPGTFQRCMVAISHDMIKKTIEVCMDDFSVFGDSFSSCLSHSDMMLKWCQDTNLVLNWEKSHFMVKEGVVLGHKITKSGIKVDRAKVDVISKLPPLTTKLTEAPILVSPEWDLLFELMCDASDYAIGADLGQRKTNILGLYTMLVKPYWMLKLITPLLKRAFSCSEFTIEIQNDIASTVYFFEHQLTRLSPEN